MIAALFAGLLLAASPTPNAQTAAPSYDQSGNYMIFKQAEFGPSWGHYRNLLAGVSAYCGLQSTYCEVYCPKGDGGKSCRVVYGCGEHMTKSTEARAGELIIMDCRWKNPALSQ